MSATTPLTSTGSELDRLTAAEREQLPGESGGAVRRSQDVRHPRPDEVIAGELDFEEPRPADDGGQHVVEVVGDAAGELPDRFEFLALAETRFEIASLGDIAGHADEPGEPFPAVGERPEHGGADEAAAVLAAAHAFALGVTQLARVLEPSIEGADRRVEQRGDGLVLHFRGGIPEDVLSARLPADDRAAVVEDEHRVVLDAVEQQAHPRFGFAQPAIGGAPIALPRLGDHVRMVERRAGGPAELRHQLQVVVGEQRAPPLYDDDCAPGMHPRHDRCNQHAAAMLSEPRRRLRLALRLAC